MSRTKKVFYNSLSTAILQILTVISGLIIPRMMLETYGSELNGLVSSVVQFISYFNLVEAGIAGAAIFALYKPLANKDYKEVNGIVSAAKKFYFQSGYIFTILVIGFALIFPLYIETEALSKINVSVLIIIIGSSGFLEFFTLSKYRVLLTADQKTYILSVASIVQVVLNTAIIVILTKNDVNIVLLRLIALTSILSRSIILMTYFKLKYKFLNFNEKPNIAALKQRWDALYLQILGIIHSGAPIVIITLMLRDLKLVSVFTIYSLVIGGISGLLGIFINGLSASFGEIIARDEIKTLQKSYKEFEFSFYILISIVYAVSFHTIMPFIKIYTSGISDINYNLPLVGFLFVLNGLLFNIKTPQGLLVISAGLYKDTRVQTTIQGAISISLGIVLAPYFGIVGILIASIISNLYRVIDLLIFIPKRLTKLPIMDTVYRIIFLLFAIIVVNVTLLFINYEPNTFVIWIFYTIAISLYAVGIVLVTAYLFDKIEMMNIYKRLKLIIKKT